MDGRWVPILCHRVQKRKVSCANIVQSLGWGYMAKEHHIACAHAHTHAGLIMTPGVRGHPLLYTEHLSMDVLQGHRAHRALCSTAAHYAFKCARFISLYTHISGDSGTAQALHPPP